MIDKRKNQTFLHDTLKKQILSLCCYLYGAKSHEYKRMSRILSCYRYGFDDLLFIFGAYKEHYLKLNGSSLDSLKKLDKLLGVL